MPLMMDWGRIPARWAGKQNSRRPRLDESRDTQAECVRISLINNMPDAALEDTELQFFELIDAASGDIPVRLQLHSLPEVPRSDRGQQHLSSFYYGIDDLWNSRFDGVIITGTEPRRPDLRDEPYWSTLVDVLDWAEENTVSTVLSCLAAHAGVLHSDGIRRHALKDKQFGVFEFRRVSEHALTKRIENLMRIPHSRWNEVREDALASCGYMVLARSAEAGADLFVKKKRKCLFVHFQGHPEYGARTLLKEYQRDIRRFLGGERETYPSMPRGYFDMATTKCLAGFRENALSHPREELLSVFPEAVVVDTLENTWHSSATRVYRNWLQYVVSKKAESSAFQAVARVGRL